MTKKYYLDQSGLERLVVYINDALNNKADIGSIPDNVVIRTELANYALKTDIPAEADLSGYATKLELEDYVTDAELQTLANQVTGVYHFRGSVADLEALQAIENPAEGDVYNIESTGMNAAWTGTVWDEFGTIVDLTPYALNENIQAISIPTVDSILYGGARAVVNDMAGIQAMLANNQSEVDIILNKDMALTETLIVPENKKVNLNLSGNTINIASGKEITVQGEMVIDGDGSINAAKWGLTAYGEDAKLIINNGHFEANEAPLAVQQGAQLIVNDGEFIGNDNCPIMGQGNSGQGNVNIVINGGKFIAHISSTGYTACGIYMPNSGKLTMNGGEIISDGAGIVMRAGEVELNGGSIQANGVSGVKGKVGDSQITVGPYAIVYDEKAKYPGASEGEFKLTIGANMQLVGTDGPIDTILSNGATANIIDNAGYLNP